MFATSGRAQLAYEITGVEGGADVLLIHAGVNDRRSWQYVVERLGPRHRCVAFDMRGFGETTYEREDGWSPVTDAVAVLDAAGIERPVVVACSMGGQAAIDLALERCPTVSRISGVAEARPVIFVDSASCVGREARHKEHDGHVLRLAIQGRLRDLPRHAAHADVDLEGSGEGLGGVRQAPDAPGH